MTALTQTGTCKLAMNASIQHTVSSTANESAAPPPQAAALCDTEILAIRESHLPHLPEVSPDQWQQQQHPPR